MTTPDAPSPAPQASGAELVAALGTVRRRIPDACAMAGRDPREVTLVAVTKTRPAADVATLARLGVLDVGENKDQEARAKIAELAGDAGARARPALAHGRDGCRATRRAAWRATPTPCTPSTGRSWSRALADAAGEHRDTALDVFVQVSLDGDPERGGVAEDGLAAITDAVAERPELRLRGLMAVPPIGADVRRRVRPPGESLPSGCAAIIPAPTRSRPA